MAKYKHTDIEYGQGLFLTVNLKEQLLSGTFEYMLDNLIGNKIDISMFDENYNNDETGAKAIPPAVLIKLIIYGYSKGMKSSRKISELCEKNIIAKALAKGLEPHWTTIASFISNNSEIFQDIFVKVLAYCAELGLIGGKTFAIDGCRLPSNASIELSGTKSELEKKLVIYRRMAEKHIAKHQRQDERGELDDKAKLNYHKRQKKLSRQIEKISNFLEYMEQKEGKRLTEIKSNVTDNESAMIRSSSGYIQGYIGMAVSDAHNQIIVSAEAVGSATEGEHFPRLLDDALGNMEKVEVKPPEVNKRVMLGDNDFFSEDNFRACCDQNIEAIIPDDQYKKRLGGNEEKQEKKKYEAIDFKYHEEDDYYECPAGKRLEYKRDTVMPGGHEWKEYCASVKDCRICSRHAKCLKSKKEINKIKRGRTLMKIKNNESGSLCGVMKEKLNTKEYQDKYSYRIQIVEPVFANIKYCKGLNQFTLRGKKKVNGQWLLYCIVHNLGKCLKGYNFEMEFT